MSLISELKASIDNDKSLGYDQEQVMFPTGFMNFDYLNGQATIKDNGEKKVSIGIDCGKIVTIIGKSGTGKTTLALQMAANIIKPFENGSIFIEDFEQATSKERVRMITGMSEAYYDEHVSLKKIGLSTEGVMRLALQIMKFKTEHEKELLVDDPYGSLEDDGKPRKVLPPTVIVVDSVAMMMPEAQLDEEMAGQMQATAMAKANTQLFKRLAQVCMKGAIIPIFINHITQKVSTGPMPTAASINYLKQDESLPGGNAPQFLTNTLIKLVASTKLEPDKGYQIKGFTVKAEIIKSRTAEAGRSVDLIFNQTEGYDNELSLLEYIKANGKLKGAGVSYKLEGLEDHTFRLSAFKEKLKEDEVLRNHFYKLGKELLENSLRQSSKFTPTELAEEKEEDTNQEGLEDALAALDDSTEE